MKELAVATPCPEVALEEGGRFSVSPAPSVSSFVKVELRALALSFC